MLQAWKCFVFTYSKLLRTQLLVLVEFGQRDPTLQNIRIRERTAIFVCTLHAIAKALP